MSFYGSVYYQLVDTFYKVLIKNSGKASIKFPSSTLNDYSHLAAGRKGIFDLSSGNRWIAFSQDENNAFKLWHTKAGGGSLADIYNFHKINEDEIPSDKTAIVLSPDDYFVTTGISLVDKAGHIIPGEKTYYKMPKSDVNERLDGVEAEVKKIKELDQKQDQKLNLQQEYVGDWATYRGKINDSTINDNDWFPSISMAIGGMSQMINGTDTSSTNTAYLNNKKVSITGAIGNLSDLLKSYETAMELEPEKGSSTVKVHQINLVDVLIYLKNTLIDNLATELGRLTTNVDTQGRLLNSIDQRLQDLEEEDVPGLMAEVEDILDSENGILATAKNYTDQAVNKNTKAINKINSETEGILINAQTYTNNKIKALSVTDKEENNLYVSAVSLNNGKITVSRSTLPTYTLTTGSDNGTVAFNGADVAVKGLGSAAYLNVSAFEVEGAAAAAKSEAIAKAKTETENQIAALIAEGGAIQVNAKAIENLQKLLEDYTKLVLKVDELEQRIITLESPLPEEPEPEPEPTPEEGTDDPETT